VCYFQFQSNCGNKFSTSFRASTATLHDLFELGDAENSNTCLGLRWASGSSCWTQRVKPYLDLFFIDADDDHMRKKILKIPNIEILNQTSLIRKLSHFGTCQCVTLSSHTLSRALSQANHSFKTFTKSRILTTHFDNQTFVVNMIIYVLTP
jgi:hypothetical protein